MNDDIVTRLREGNGQGCKCYAAYSYACACDAIWAEQYILEAADEIERLRAELKDADDDFHALKEMFDKMRADRDHWRNVVDSYFAFEGLVIARCCRDWPAVPPGQGGSCKQCGEKPQIIWEEYIGPYHGE